MRNPSPLIAARGGLTERQHQHQSMARVGAAAPNFAAIQAAPAAGESLLLLDPVEGAGEAAAPALACAWKLSPVRAKIAALFLEPRSAREAILSGAELRAALPGEAQPGSEGLPEFLRVAIAKGKGGALVLEAGWSAANPGSSPGLLGWCAKLCQARAPTCASCSACAGWALWKPEK